jgi:hypothetical protein
MFEKLLGIGFLPEQIGNMTPYQAMLITAGAEKKIRTFNSLEELKAWQNK